MRPFWGAEVGYPMNLDVGARVAQPNGGLSPLNGAITGAHGDSLLVAGVNLCLPAARTSMNHLCLRHRPSPIRSIRCGIPRPSARHAVALPSFAHGRPKMLRQSGHR